MIHKQNDAVTEQQMSDAIMQQALEEALQDFIDIKEQMNKPYTGEVK